MSVGLLCPEASTVGAHGPPWHALPRQSCAHAPQFFGPPVVPTQTPPQSPCPAGQPHIPPEHTPPAIVQALPHAPQFFVSVLVSVHAFEHTTSLPGHAHVPPAHVVPVTAHAWP